MKLKQLERELSGLEGFEKPSSHREQYTTPPDLAARLLYHASLRGDIGGRRVCDLGSGTGILAIGAALLGASSVTGVEIDPDAIAVAERNAARKGVSLSLIQGDLNDPGLAGRVGPMDTVVMNPPFGAQNPHADRAFINAAIMIAPVTYGIFNRGSLLFLKRFIEGRAEIEGVIQGTLSLKRIFSFHRKDQKEIPVEIVILSRLQP
jgi:putative methylase